LEKQIRTKKVTKMTTTHEYLEDRAGALGEITSFLNIGALWRHWQAHRSVRHLASLDDHVLRDIGLTRGDVEWAERVPLSQNAVLALEDRVRRRHRSAGA
jgi:uncharacterized protein YjiS (DUF1127 family)